MLNPFKKQNSKKTIILYFSVTNEDFLKICICQFSKTFFAIQKIQGVQINRNLTYSTSRLTDVYYLLQFSHFPTILSIHYLSLIPDKNYKIDWLKHCVDNIQYIKEDF